MVKLLETDLTWKVTLGDLVKKVGWNKKTDTYGIKNINLGLPSLLSKDPVAKK